MAIPESARSILCGDIGFETHLVLTFGPWVFPGHRHKCFHRKSSLLSVHLLYILHLEAKAQLEGPAMQVQQNTRLFTLRIIKRQKTLLPEAEGGNKSSQLGETVAKPDLTPPATQRPVEAADLINLMPRACHDMYNLFSLPVELKKSRMVKNPILKNN